MPALPPVFKVIKAVVNFTNNGVPGVNVFHVRYSGNTPSAIDMNSFATIVHGQWAQAFITSVHSGLILTSVNTADLTSPLGSQGTHVASIPGTATGSAAPASASVVGSWVINNRYRGGKPRTYIGGLVTNQMADPQHWLPALVTNMTNAFTGFMNGINTAVNPAGVGPFALGCVHYRSGHVALATPQFDPFVSVSVRSNIRSQRGRLT